MGSTPYPGMRLNHLSQLLKEGKIMQKPTSCPQSIYDIMVKCFAHKSNKRPRFTEIVQMLKNEIKTKDEIPNEILEDNYVGDLSVLEETPMAADENK